MSYTLVNRLSALGVLTLLALLQTGCGINNIPAYDEAANAAWSQVQNQYQRRADLVPNLVETVKGFAAQEKEVLIGVVEARSKVAQTQIPKDILTDPQAFARYQENQDALSQALGRLMVVVERYPELRSNQNFLALQSQLEGTENRIAVARRDYIQTVQRYNTEIRTFPGRLWHMALYSEYTPKQNFAAQAAAQETPKVSF